jgi:hypothetical protein
MTLTSTTRLRRLLICAMVSSAIAAPAAAAEQDLRMPDTRDAARAAQQSHYTDLRSPDARDAGRVAAQLPSTGARNADLRSPDARDAAGRYVSTPTVATASPASGFDWASALIGAAAGAGILLALLAALTGSRRLRMAAR